MGMPFSLYRKFRWNFYKVKRHCVSAQLAEKKSVALQHCSRAKSSQANSLFHVEHLVKASQRRSLNLVRTIPVHLIRTSKAQFEFSAAGTCRVFSESRCKRWLELVQQVYEE